MNDYGETDGEWLADIRRLKVMAEPWINATRLRQALENAKHAAMNADAVGTRPALITLDKAAKELEKQVTYFAKEVALLHREVGYLVAAVVQARVLAAQRPDKPRQVDVELEEQARWDAEAQLGLDRLAKFYGIHGKGER